MHPTRVTRFLLFFLVTLLHSPIVFSYDLASQVESVKLSNGMRWLIVYRPEMPVFSGMVMLKVGGVDEEVGKTGLAHMFEHMAFKGSKDIGTKDFAKEAPILKQISEVGAKLAAARSQPKPDVEAVQKLKAELTALEQQAEVYRNKNEVWLALTRKGADDLNAFTSKDATAYHASLPANYFPLWAYATADMVLHPAMREFYSEVDVVMEERRLRTDNSPMGMMMETLANTAFPEGPYHWSPIGFQQELLALTMEDAQKFHEKYYLPANMVGVVVGAVSKKTALPVLEKYFGKQPAKEPPAAGSAPSFLFSGEKRKTIAYPAEPYLMIGFHKPNAPSRDDYVFDLLDGVLCNGRTGRFYKKIVQEKKLASAIDCSASWPGSRLENLFVIFASPNQGISPEKLEAAIYKEIDQAKKEISEAERKKVLTEIRSSYFWGMSDGIDLAEQLARSEAVLGDWHYVTNYMDQVASVSIEEMKQVADKYFRENNRVVIVRVKGKQ